MSAESAPAAHSIGVVGSGAVGQAVAMTLVAVGFCEQLMIASRTLAQATSIAADLDDMRLAIGSPTRPRAATTAGLQDCQVVVIAARGRFTNTNGTRLGGGTANGRIIIELTLTLRGFGGVVVMVTNPVDLMSRLFAEVSGISRVVGIGSNLDSARYRRLVLGLAEDVEELCSPYRRGWLGLPVSFTGGHARVHLPPLDPEETRCLQASEDKLHAAYAALADQFHSLDRPQTPNNHQ